MGMWDNAGMWDKLLANPKEAEPRLVSMLKAFIPIAGPFMAMKSFQEDRMKPKDQYIAQNIAYTNPDQLDELGRRVQQRMLDRTDNEFTTQGLKAATALSRAAADPANMGNYGNALMQAADKLTAGGDPQSGTTMAQIAHKSFQTPWKPSEGGANPDNFQMPDGKIVTLMDPVAKKAALAAGGIQVGIEKPDQPIEIVKGADIGAGGDTANDAFAIRRDSNGRLVEARKLDNAAKVSVGGTDLGGLLTAGDVSKSIIGFGDAFNGYKDTERTVNDLQGILKANPTGGVSGWSGTITAFAGKASNLMQFLGGIGKRVNAQGETEAAVLSRYSGRFQQLASKLPIQDQARAQALVVSLGYQIARLNNMGTAGGGRGITDADMEYALQQLGAATTPDAMAKVLQDVKLKAFQRLKDQASTTDTYIKSVDPKKGLPPQWMEELNRMDKSFATPEISDDDQKLLQHYLDMANGTQ